ncbi:hypothetical protein [Metabacillus schmidteae]|uniref:hypothetical protein n=1 Tax=Metabacillus schmidteae TaxID=2730405 RepID=UPI001589351A|nr:hypothetical protein [Metabacillus schmidteae]
MSFIRWMKDKKKNETKRNVLHKVDERQKRNEIKGNVFHKVDERQKGERDQGNVLHEVDERQKEGTTPNEMSFISRMKDK